MKPKINWNDKEEVRDYNRKYGKKYRDEHPEKEKARNKKWKEDNPEKEKARNKKWKEDNPEWGKKYYQENKDKPEFKEKAKARNKKWREDNPDCNKKWSKEHPVEKKAHNKKWNKEHPEEIKASNHKRRARIKGNGGSYTLKEIKNLRKETKGICKGWKRKPHYVGDENLEIEHIIPLIKGGTNNIENIQLMCKSCNCSKGTN